MEIAVALDSNFKLLLISRILVAVEEMVAPCYNRDQTCVCIVCVKLPRVLSRRGARHHPWGSDTNNTHTIIFHPLTKSRICNQLTKNMPLTEDTT